MSYQQKSVTYRTDKAILMPIEAQRLQHGVRHGLPATPTLRAVTIRMAAHAPRVAILFHERRLRIEGITALCAEEVPSMPLRTASDDDLAFDWGLAALAARREQLMEVQMAVEA